ncbi:hypothetical protein [Roseiarcus sp.]|uniref:hypothetical protein n=1 Tax=Roseiarcus sp. TaxID=1969460 RepID=UPI003F9E74D6
MELRTVLGRHDMPTMHFARPVFWIGSTQILAPTAVVSDRGDRQDDGVAGAVRKVLKERPDWWQFFLQPTLLFGDIRLDIAG